MLGIQSCATKIGTPVEDWPKNCHAIVLKFLAAGIVPGKDRYGLYLGPVSPDSILEHRALQRHGWIERPTGGIVDPTRWVFEARKPYIFICDIDDPRTAEYDIGGSSIRTTTNADPPEHTGESFEQLVFPDILDAWFLDVFGRTDLCKRQSFWLANQSPDQLGILALPVYKAFVAADLAALIPRDFQQVVLEKRTHNEI